MAGIWVRSGTVTLTNGSKKVTGSGTAWNTGANKVTKGCAFIYNNIPYEVDYVTSDTELYLVDIYGGTTGSGLSYRIQIAVTDTIPELASRIATALAYWNGQAANLQALTTGSGNVTLTAPDGTQVTIPSYSNMQPKDALLTALAALTTAADKLVYFTGADTVDQTSLTSFARSLLDDIDAATARTTLGAQASDATLTALAGVTTSADKLIYATGSDTFSTSTLTSFARTLLDDNDAATARATIGLGNVANTDTTNATNITSGTLAKERLGQIQWGLENSTSMALPISTWPMEARSDSSDTLFRICVLPPSIYGLYAMCNIRGHIGAWVGAKTSFDISFTSRDGFKLSGTSSGGLQPRIQAYSQSDGSVWVYLYMSVYSVFRGEISWNAGQGIVPKMDTETVKGTLFFDTNNGGSQSIPMIFTDANLINEGTFTPRVQVDNVGIMSDAGSYGQWKTIGDQVWIDGKVYLNDATDFSRSLTIINLPFVSAPLVGDVYPMVPIATYGMTINAREVWGAQIQYNSTIELYCRDVNGTQRRLNAADITNESNPHFRFSLTYRI